MKAKPRENPEPAKTLEEQRVAQGLPPNLEDEAALRRVASLIRSQEAHR